MTHFKLVHQTENAGKNARILNWHAHAKKNAPISNWRHARVSNRKGNNDRLIVQTYDIYDVWIIFTSSDLACTFTCHSNTFAYVLEWQIGIVVY
jgi:hypothetical protein